MKVFVTNHGVACTWFNSLQSLIDFRWEFTYYRVSWTLHGFLLIAKACWALYIYGILLIHWFY